MNDKFLTSVGQYGIDFSQIDRIELNLNEGKYTNKASVVLLFIKNEKYPIIVLPYDTKDKARFVYDQLKSVVYNTESKVVVLSDYRKK